MTHVRPRHWCLALLALVGACAPAERPSMPASRAGADLVGEDGLALLPEEWSAAASAGERRALLVRFFTDECPYCAASLPALDALRARYASRGLATLAVFHPKPPGDLGATPAIEIARSLGFEGPVAHDADWEVLHALVPAAGRSAPSSVSLLFDAAGRVRWFHPGPELFPSSAPGDALADADFRDLERAVQVLLAEADE